MMIVAPCRFFDCLVRISPLILRILKKTWVLFKADFCSKNTHVFSFICPRKFLQDKDFQWYNYFKLRMRELSTPRNFTIPLVAQAAPSSLLNSHEIRVFCIKISKLLITHYDVYHTHTHIKMRSRFRIFGCVTYVLYLQ